MDRQQKLQALQASIKPEEGAASLLAPGRQPVLASAPDSRPPTPPGQVPPLPSPFLPFLPLANLEAVLGRFVTDLSLAAISLVMSSSWVSTWVACQ